MALAGAPFIAKCEQNVCLNASTLFSDSPALRAALFTRLCIICRVNGSALSWQSTRELCRCRCPLRAAASRLVNGIHLRRPLFGAVTIPVCPPHAEPPIDQIHIRPLQRHHFPAPQSGIT